MWALPRLGRLPIGPPTPPGGIGLIVGSPPADELGGIEVEVDEGYIIEDDDMPYGFCEYEGGPMALAGDTCE
jgi:hypothetical protein